MAKSRSRACPRCVRGIGSAFQIDMTRAKSEPSLQQPTTVCVCVFDELNLLGCVRNEETSLLEPTSIAVLAADQKPNDVATEQVAAFVGTRTRVREIATLDLAGSGRTVLYLARLPDGLERPSAEWIAIGELAQKAEEEPESLAPLLHDLLPVIRAHAIRIPYLNFGENEYVFRFRTEGNRNRAVYSSDQRSRMLYHSTLCDAIKAAKRSKERTASEPAVLDFGAVRYVLPSHFGFCLGVQNAIERAYETILGNPDRRVFMISELIHNPFVNQDLRERGLIYLQSDRSERFTNPDTGKLYWDELERGDIVLTPAFGATDEDKVRLIEKGVAINRYDATCMLVEKVWKAARRYSQEGYTVVIHGKSEHEETKATFSNCSKYGPSIMIRNRREAELLGEVILAETRAEKEKRFAEFQDRHTEGFDVERDLERLAVVNQTTLLRNETVGIIDHLESVLAARYGADRVAEHMHGKSRGDTLCYATQVNQDALGRALETGADMAIVVGGRNSSNTYQLYRMCEQHFEGRAFYIQSEKNILSLDQIRNYRFPHLPAALGSGVEEDREFLGRSGHPVSILITGGASCPDGIIQQVISRINSLLPAEKLRSIDDVLEEVSSD